MVLVPKAKVSGNDQVIRAHKILVKGERQGIYPKKTEDRIREAIAPILGTKKPATGGLGGW